VIAALVFAAVTSSVLDFEAARFRAMTSNDLPRLAGMLGDDLVYVHTSGHVDSKSSFLETLRSGELRYRSIEPRDVRVRSFGDAAVITGSAKVLVTAGGADRHLDIRYTSVYVQRAGQWRLVSWQSTLVGAPPSAHSQ